MVIDTNTDVDADIVVDELESLKQKLAEYEADKADPDSKNFAIRNRKLQEKNLELQETLRGLNETIVSLNEIQRQTEVKVAEKSGDWKSIVEMKNDEISALKDKLDAASLGVIKLTIGRDHNLPDSVAKLLPGTTPDEIEANAIKVREDIKPKSGFSDARQSGGVIVTGNGPKKPPSSYIPVRPETAF